MTDQWQKARELAYRAASQAHDDWLRKASAEEVRDIPLQDYAARFVDAALSAFSAAGYEVVPKTLSAGMENASPGSPYMDQDVWERMITAALKERQT